MPVIAPWLRPADVIGSASAGANIGLAARARDLQEAAQQQAADEFIARLNQQAQQFDRNLVSEQDIARQRLAQALRQQDALDIYHKGELEVRNKEAATRAARLLKENGFEPKDVTTPGGTKLVQTGMNSFQVIHDPFKPEEVMIGDEAYIRTSPNKYEKKDKPPNVSNNPDAIIARAKLNEAIRNFDTSGQAQAEEALRKAMAPRKAPATNLVQQLQGTNAPALTGRPPVKLSDGSIATVRSIGVGDENGEWVIPTIVNGKPVSDEEATKLWRTGKNPALGGPFKTVDESNAFAQKFHESEAKRLGLGPTEEIITIDTKEEFDRLPSGAKYKRKDGKTYRKP